MIYGNRAVNAACVLLIAAAVVLSPLYGAWLIGGMIADKLERWDNFR